MYLPIVNFALSQEALDNHLEVIPVRASNDAGGFDLFSADNYVIHPGQDTLISTGVHMQIPTGYVGLISPRSSVARKRHLRVGARVVDSDYRGVVFVHLFNDSNDDRIISQGERIAQILFIPVLTGSNVITLDQMTATDRGTGCLGSTGR